MKISIVVPNFNGAAHLGACLESIIAQKQDGIDLEIVVMDGGSSDESPKIISSYEPHLSYWISKRDGGQADALNQGFARCTGEIMAWLCSDDLYLQDTLKKIGAYFAHSPSIDVVYGDLLWVDADARPIRPQREIAFDQDIFLWTYNFIPQPATFWRRDMWLKSGGIDASLVCAMDRDLWLKFIQHGARFGHIPDYLAAMRSHPEQKTNRLRVQSRLEDIKACEQFLGCSIGPVESAVKHAWHRARRITKRAASGAYWARFPSPDPIANLFDRR
jgi:glycosyltransferase involved in cell wall biosynthesis